MPALYRSRLSTVVFLLFIVSSKCVIAAEQRPLQVFAAASLAAVMEPIRQAYQDSHEQQILLNYGASSTLSRQISYGAPADIFISANPRWMQTLLDRHIISSGGSTNLASNSLLLVAPAGSSIPTSGQLPTAEQLKHWLQDRRLAVGDPLHVPVGLYAARALKFAELWNAVKTRLSPTESALSSLALLRRDEVALGIIYKSDLASAPHLLTIAELPLPSGEHISYPAAIIGEDESGEAERFMTFLQSAPVKRLFLEMGFLAAS